MNEELKQCPFCGSNEILRVQYNSSQPPYIYRIVCKNCECGTTWHPIKMAIDIWNKRVADNSRNETNES